MPDASGAFKGISVPADAWERVFGGGRLACPSCSRPMLSLAERCGGSFLDTDHPASVAPVVVAR